MSADRNGIFLLILETVITTTALKDCGCTVCRQATYNRILDMAALAGSTAVDNDKTKR